MQKKNRSGTYSRPVRILALVMSILVSGGILTYLVMLFLNLFHFHAH